MTGELNQTTVSCPTCGEDVIWSPRATWRPFCSERCRLLDLGAWFEEARGIPDSEPTDPAELPPSAE